jgi:hypothetical protein
VQFSKGSFVNRVQIKTAQGIKWLTVPLAGHPLEQAIGEVRINNNRDWRSSHLGLLKQAYNKAPCSEEMLTLVESVYDTDCDTIGELSKLSLDAVCNYYSIDRERRFIDVEELGISGNSSQRVLDIVQHFQGDIYITGLGARKYLDHGIFEDAGIRVEYMNYRKMPYEQLHGEFTPYVSVLDLIANTGSKGVDYMCPRTIYWKDLLPDE